ncbi:MAG: ribosome maturation factor, partial [Gemmatimonadetes bacterium]|nr:ribosome maturation factor [Gemmatimonadota bacterium]
VSRALEPWLDGREDVPERYVLEVSSPGVDRPLLRDRDYERFRGEQVAVKGHEVLADRARRLEGELLGLEGEGGSAAVRLRLPDGDEVSIPRELIAGANLVFTWKR